MRRLRVMLDADVIVDAQVRDLFCRMAEAELIDLRWSGQVLAECRRALVDKLRLDPAKVDRMMGALVRAFPEASVENFDELAEDIVLPDPDDRHVLAAAVRGECDLLVTYNVRDYPDAATDQFDLEVLSVDDAVVLLTGWYQTAIAEVVDRQIAAMRRPSTSRDEFLQRLASRAPIGAIALGAALGIESYVRMFSDVLDSESGTSPQDVVRQLLSALSDDSDRIVDLVDPDLSRRLTGLGQPTSAQLRSSLATILEDVTTSEGWGFATAKRIHGPDTELVKLVRTGDDPVIAFEPRVVQGHLFYLRWKGDGWVLVDLDGPDPGVSTK